MSIRWGLTVVSMYVHVAGLDITVYSILTFHTFGYISRYILPAVYAINTSVQASTKQQPFRMMFNRLARGAIALNVKHDAEIDEEEYGVRMEQDADAIASLMQDQMDRVCVSVKFLFHLIHNLI